MPSPPSSPLPLPALPRRRIASIDALRGLTFVVMLFVNALSGAAGVPAGLQHLPADADGMGLADIVFPAFLFVVGMSVPFGLNQRIAARGDTWKPLRQVGTRAFGLIVLGFFMVNAEEGYNEAAMGMPITAWILCFYGAAFLVWGTFRFANPWHDRLVRGAGAAVIVTLALVYRSGPDGQGWMASSWWGILGCIGWAYLVTSAVYLFARGRMVALALAVAGCVAWFALSRAYDGNGVLAMHATHTSIVLCGALCVLLFFGAGNQGGEGLRRPPALAAGAGLAVVLAAAAWLLHHAYPISKIGATPPWALYCAALCTGLFVLVYWLVELRGVVRWTALVQPAAASPLVTYLLPMILVTLMRWLGLRWWPALGHGAGAIAFSLLFAAGTIAVVAVLNRHHVKLKL
jgi:heparan-alpha-glucosaminide N-acetyltransferase